MSSYTIQVQPRASYTIEYSNQRGPQGATGPSGSTTTDASLLVSGTLADARLSSNVLLVSGNLAGLASAATSRTNLGLGTADSPTFAGLTLTGTGTLQLPSGTTAQRVASQGIRWNTTDSRHEFYTGSTWYNHARLTGDTFTGAVVATTLSESATAATGTGGLVRATSPTLVTPNIGDATATVLRRGSTSFDLIVLFEPFVFSCSLSGFTTQKHCSFGWQAGAGAAQGVATSSAGNFAFSNSSTDSTATRDTNISRNAAGVLQVGTTANNASGSLLLTNLTASGTLRVGGGTIITNVLSATATLDFGSIAANSVADLTISVTGAAVGDTVAIGVPNASLVADVSFFGWVSATDTVTIRATNNSSTTARDPASGTFRATVIRF